MVEEAGARAGGRSAGNIAAAVFDESYFVGGTKSNYQDYAGVGRAIDKGFMPEVRRYAALAAAGKSGKAYLDIGCAFGYYLERLSKLGWQAAGVDVSAYAIGRGRARGIANLHVARAQELPFRDDSFDFVTAIDVIEHIPPEDGRAAVAETRRVLRPGGLAFFATPNFLSNRYWNVSLPGFEDPDETHINYQSVESLRSLFAEFSRCEVRGHTPFSGQLQAFDAIGHPMLRVWLIRRLARWVVWKRLGRSLDHSSYLHAVAIK